MTKVVSFLWFAKEAAEAVEFYTSVIPNSKVVSTMSLPADSPSGPAGSVIVIDFTLAGQNFSAMQAGPLDSFNHAFSVSVLLDTQEEVDRVWNAFVDNGAEPEACGWLKDRWGLSWQITPRKLLEMVADPDRERAKRAAEAMLKMVKIDLAAIERAFNGQD